MGKVILRLGQIILVLIMIFIGLLFYHSFNVISPAELLNAQDIHIEDLKVDKIIISTSKNNTTEEFEIDDEVEIRKILNDVLGIRSKRDILLELKLSIFGRANIRRGDLEIGEFISFNAKNQSNDLSVHFELLHGSQISIYTYSKENYMKKYFMYKINGVYKYQKWGLKVV